MQRTLALAAFFSFAALDLFVKYVNFTVLFCIPLVLLLGSVRNARYVWYYVGLVVVTVYTVYVLKQLILYGRDPSELLSYRIYNRTVAAIMVALLGVVAQAWLYWQHERTLLTYLDQDEEDEVNATAGVIACVGLGLLITAVDLFSPNNFNLPVLSVVPLYLVSWSRSRKALWTTAVTLIALLWFGYSMAPPPIETGYDYYIFINRLLVSLALVMEAGLLTWQMHCRQRDLGDSNVFSS